MPTSALLASLRGALQLLPIDWILWSVDAEGVFLTHEGPATPGGREDTGVGRTVWEVYRGEETVLDFAARVLREPAAAELTSGTRRFHVAGAPIAGGGAVGVAMRLGLAHGEGDRSGTAGLPAVTELLRPVPEIGAGTGDLLLWNPERPESVGCYREIAADRLPDGLLRELGLTRSSDPAPVPPAPGGAARSLRERAAHLRLVP